MRNIIATGFGLALLTGLTGTYVSRQQAVAQTASPTGLIVKASPYSVEETEHRFVQVLDAKGLNIFATIDHAQNAEDAGLQLSPTRVIIFGNPNVGTLLMQCQQNVGIDLPLKLLIWEDEQGVYLAYNDPHYLSERHHLDSTTQQVIDTMANALSGLTDQTIRSMSS